MEAFNVGGVLSASTKSTTRRIGTLGTVARVLVGLALLALAFADQPSGLIWRLELYELVLGLGVLPAVMVVIGLLARRYADGSLRFTGEAGIAANCAAIVVLFAIPYTAGAAALFYGTSLLVAALRGLPHCEATILSNLILRRDDQVGCPTFTPIDAWEARRERAKPGSP
jgi:hypothetical protein